MRFDATGIFGVENCSLVLDTFSSINGTTLYGKDVKELFTFEISKLGQVSTNIGNTIRWTVENLEGTKFNSFGLLAASLSSLSYSLMGTQNAGDEDINMVTVVDKYIFSREIVREYSPITFLPFKNFKWVVEDQGSANLQLHSFLFYYCKATGDICQGDDEYPTVAEGQVSPAMCDYGFRGYKYRECHNGVLGEVHLENCAYKIPSNLEYVSARVELVMDVEMAPLVPSFKELVTAFRISRELPRGLSFDTMSGVISGTPLEEVTLTEYTIVGENPVGATQTTLNLSVRKGHCVSEGNFPTTEVGEEAEFDCALLGNFVGSQKRICTLGATDGEWGRVSGMCVSVVTLIVIIVLAIIVKYLSLLVDLIFQKQKYLIESVEKIQK